MKSEFRQSTVRPDARPRGRSASRVCALLFACALIALMVLEPSILRAEVDPGRGPSRESQSRTESRVVAASVGNSPSEAEVERADEIDPWEPMNRGIFLFNEKADIYLVAPVARGWRFLTPGFVRKGIENFNGLLEMPVVLGNGIMQLKPTNAAQDVARIVYNATFGIAGFIDIATMVGIPENDEDFGQTLGFWGVPPGPYLMLPGLGPSNIRDGLGRLGDTAGTFYFSLLPFWTTLLVQGVDLVNLRARFLEEVDENRRESFDYYVFLRDAYLQNRQSRVGRARGVEATGVSEAQEDLYYFDDEDGNEEEEGDGGGDSIDAE